MKECDFQIKLAERFERHGHTVSLHDAGTTSWKKRFSTSGLAPDLLVETSPLWEHHETLPLVAVETKIGEDWEITDVLDGIQKVIALKEAESRTEYRIGGVRVDPPKYYLLATPTSVDMGFVSRWRAAPNYGLTCCPSYSTMVFNQFLNRYQGAILCKGGIFDVNGVVGNKGFARRFYFVNTPKSYY